ncbi:hypothetical protein LJR254_001186 [Rhizobium sp. LjRoot254]
MLAAFAASAEIPRMIPVFRLSADHRIVILICRSLWDGADVQENQTPACGGVLRMGEQVR